MQSDESSEEWWERILKEEATEETMEPGEAAQELKDHARGREEWMVRKRLWHARVQTPEESRKQVGAWTS